MKYAVSSIKFYETCEIEFDTKLKAFKIRLKLTVKDKIMGLI